MTSAEIEGGWAGLCGKHGSACPYLYGSMAWHQWQQARQHAVRELRTIRVRWLVFPLQNGDQLHMTVRDAIAGERWKPKYANPRFIEAYREGAIGDH